jgi:phospholipid transport system substrate-binding protein
MKKRFLILNLIFVFLIVSPFSAYAAAATDAVKGGVDKVLTQLRDPAFKQKSKEDQIEGIRAIINDIFDWEELSKRTLGRNWRKFNPEQQKEFIDLFSKLLEGVYADRLLAYSDEKVVFEKETELKKGRVEVASHIRLADGKQVPLNYRMIQKDGTWRVYDIVIEGVSMVKNYRSQFKKLLKNKKPEDLIETLKKKTA